MRSSARSLVLVGVLLALPMVAAAADSSVPIPPDALVPGFGTKSDCSLCSSCGARWPVFSGSFPSSSAVAERGPQCAGDFAVTTDPQPYLCFKRNDNIN